MTLFQCYALQAAQGISGVMVGFFLFIVLGTIALHLRYLQQKRRYAVKRTPKTKQRIHLAKCLRNVMFVGIWLITLTSWRAMYVLFMY